MSNVSESYGVITLVTECVLKPALVIELCVPPSLFTEALLGPAVMSGLAGDGGARATVAETEFTEIDLGQWLWDGGSVVCFDDGSIMSFAHHH